MDDSQNTIGVENTNMAKMNIPFSARSKQLDDIGLPDVRVEEVPDPIGHRTT